MPSPPPEQSQTPGQGQPGQVGASAGGPAIGQINFASPVQDQQSMVNDINRMMNAHGAGQAP
jgi:hypothetical protein